MPQATIEEALQDLRQGKFVILVDDEDRENEGDLAIAAESKLVYTAAFEQAKVKHADLFKAAFAK